MPKSVLVVGGGIGGIATAGLMARDGYDVTLVEAHSRLGGRAGLWVKDGFRFDTGPSWYLMPEVFDHWYRLMGTSAAEHLTLTKLDPGYRVYFEPDVDQKADFVDVRASREDNLALLEEMEPGSRASMEKYLDSASLRTIWRTLGRCVEHDWRDTVSRAAYSHATKTGTLSLVLYDVTTLYFEAEDEDDLRKVGMGKEMRVDPQIVVGLLVTPGGFPLEVHAFIGNTAETTTLIAVLASFQDHDGVKDIVVVADAGMFSAGNLTALEDAGFSFIVGSRISKAPYDLAEYFTSGVVLGDGETLESKRVMGDGNNY